MSPDHDDHDHVGESGHAHDHAPKNFGRAFAIGIIVQTTFIVVEVVVGLASNSLAVLADAGHNVSDVLALGLAWAAAHFGKLGASRGRTYGWKSASILTALTNALMLVFVNGFVAWEAIGRFETPEPVAATPMIAVSLAGVAVNGFCALLFAKGGEHDLNVRAAFLHLLSDAAVAAGVAATGLLIRLTGHPWLDPIASLLIAVIMIASTWSLLRKAVNLAMHSVPQGVDEVKVKEWLVALPHVLSVHDLHIWAISTTENALTVHLVLDEMPRDAFACSIDTKLRTKFEIHHATIQLDPKGATCALAASHQ